MFGINIGPEELLPGERLILSKNANAIINLSEYGLSEIPLVGSMKWAGFGGKEAVGGRLHLTNYRLIFKSHTLNRVTGSYHIFLPTIRRISDTSRGLSKKMKVETAGQMYEFVAWGVPKLLGEIQTAVESFTDKDACLLKTFLPGNLNKLRSALRKFTGPDQLGHFLPGLLQTVSNPVDAVVLLNVKELMDRFVAE